MSYQQNSRITERKRWGLFQTLRFRYPVVIISKKCGGEMFVTQKEVSDTELGVAVKKLELKYVRASCSPVGCETAFRTENQNGK